MMNIRLQSFQRNISRVFTYYNNFRSFSALLPLPAFEQCIGNTPLLYLKSASNIAGCDIYGKAEFMNPGGSIKDRAALYIIKDAEERGVLVRGEPGIVVEGTAGNTGIGLALVSQIYGYECICVIPNTQTKEKKDTLKQMGAKLIEVEAGPYSNPNNFVRIAERIAKNLKKNSNKRVLYADQWDNMANQRAHLQGTGPEIWNQTKGKVSVFCCAIGTGGTLTGVGKFLKSMDSNITICLTDCMGAAMYNYFTTGEVVSEGASIAEGIGQGRITGQIADGFIPDNFYEIEDIHMMNILHEMQIQDGLTVGLSSGINVAGAIKVASEYGLSGTNACIVTMLCDSSYRYISKLFNPTFLKSQNLPTPPWFTSDSGPDFDAVLEQSVKESFE